MHERYERDESHRERRHSRESSPRSHYDYDRRSPPRRSERNSYSPERPRRCSRSPYRKRDEKRPRSPSRDASRREKSHRDRSASKDRPCRERRRSSERPRSSSRSIRDHDAQPNVSRGDAHPSGNSPERRSQPSPRRMSPETHRPLRRDSPAATRRFSRVDNLSPERLILTIVPQRDATPRQRSISRIAKIDANSEHEDDRPQSKRSTRDHEHLRHNESATSKGSVARQNISMQSRTHSASSSPERLARENNPGRSPSLTRAIARIFELSRNNKIVTAQQQQPPASHEDDMERESEPPRSTPPATDEREPTMWFPTSEYVLCHNYDTKRGTNRYTPYGRKPIGHAHHCNHVVISKPSEN